MNATLAVGAAQFAVLSYAMRAFTRLRSRTADLGDTRIPYFERPGAGDPLLLVHGFGGDKESWLLLAAQLGGRPLLIPDLPGFGAAGEIAPERARVGAQAHTLLRLLDHLGVQRVHLVGNSMGGGISLHLGAHAPERVNTIALLCSTGPTVADSEFQRALDRGENYLVPETLEQSQRLLGLVAETTPLLPRALERYAASRLIDPRFSSNFAGFTLDGRLGAIPDLAQIHAPVLVAHGAQDRVIHPFTARALAAGLPNAALRLLTGVGHIPQVEAPGLVARLIQALHARYAAG